MSDLTDDQLYDWIGCVSYPDGDESRAMANELLAARARIAELEEARDIAEGQWRLHCGDRLAARDDLATAGARIAELEA